MSRRVSKTDQREARLALTQELAPGETVYTVLRHVSRSGMFRRISLYRMTCDGPPMLDGRTAKVLGIALGAKDGVPVGGCGMDMGFHLVYNLSHALFDSRDPRTPESDPGYFLSQRWL